MDEEGQGLPFFIGCRGNIVTEDEEKAELLCLSFLQEDRSSLGKLASGVYG